MFEPEKKNMQVKTVSIYSLRTMTLTTKLSDQLDTRGQQYVLYPYDGPVLLSRAEGWSKRVSLPGPRLFGELHGLTGV